MRPILAAQGSRKGQDAWRAVLDAAEIPNGPINDLVEAFASPEAVALGMTVEQEHPAWGIIRQVGIPFQLSGTPASIRTPPTTLGQDTDAILAELGLSAAETSRAPDEASSDRPSSAARLGTSAHRHPGEAPA